MSQTQKKIAQLTLDDACQHGDFVAPTAFEIDDIAALSEEQFGPILHIVRFKARELAQIVDKINQTGFGLTMGIHSRNETTYRWIENMLEWATAISTAIKSGLWWGTTVWRTRLVRNGAESGRASLSLPLYSSAIPITHSKETYHGASSNPFFRRLFCLGKLESD